MGYTGYRINVYIDVNPQSPTYNTTRTERVLDSTCYNSSAEWQVMSEYCETNSQGINTGYHVLVEVDVNPRSSTYQQQRTTRVYDTTACPEQSTQPNWEFIESDSYCEQGECEGLVGITGNTGYYMAHYRDANIYSPSYGRDKWVKVLPQTDICPKCGGAPIDYTTQPLTIVITGDTISGSYIRFAQHQGTYYYSTDEGVTWNEGGEKIRISNGDRLMFKGTLTPQTAGSDHSRGIGSFECDYASYIAEGNPMSLIFGDNFANQTSLQGYDYAFANMFDYSLKGIDNLVLPATTLATYCYWRMFYGSQMTSAPADLLPATALSDSCYAFMFYHCTALTEAPDLSATTAAYGCYTHMFEGCTSLQTVPSLLLTTLATNCCNSMFNGCTALSIVPNLEAQTLVQACYAGMFANCSSLNNITCYATDISVTSGTSHWLENVASSGTFKTPSSTNWTSGVDGIPNGWTRQNL